MQLQKIVAKLLRVARIVAFIVKYIDIQGPQSLAHCVCKNYDSNDRFNMYINLSFLNILTFLVYRVRRLIGSLWASMKMITITE